MSKNTAIASGVLVIAPCFVITIKDIGINEKELAWFNVAANCDEFHLDSFCFSSFWSRHLVIFKLVLQFSFRGDSWWEVL